MDWWLVLQVAIEGLSYGMIIALIALGYTMVYGIVELINFAHGDLFMLGCFCALTLVGCIGLEHAHGPTLIALFVLVPAFCGCLNWLVDRYGYRPLRHSAKLTVLVTAIGIS